MPFRTCHIPSVFSSVFTKKWAGFSTGLKNLKIEGACRRYFSQFASNQIVPKEKLVLWDTYMAFGPANICNLPALARGTPFKTREYEKKSRMHQNTAFLTVLCCHALNSGAMNLLWKRDVFFETIQIHSALHISPTLHRSRVTRP